jgi:ATP-dependent DNA ligase
MSLHPPGFIEPCLPTGSRTAPTGPQWAYEIKHDGFRFICHRDGERVRVFSGNPRQHLDYDYFKSVMSAPIRSGTEKIQGP